MENNEIIKFIAAIAIILIGLYVKTSNREQDFRIKKYWFLVVVIGILMFSIDLYNYLK
jgi:uncharacterized membrane protein YgdD (TMEM256/DUF423 family)